MVFAHEEIDEDKGMVVDSGDFPKYRQPDLLQFFKVKEDQIFVLMLLYRDLFKAV